MPLLHTFTLCTIYFSILHFMLFLSLLIWAFLFYVIFIFLIWAFHFLFWRYLIINLNHKRLNSLWTIWLLSLAYWSCESLRLRIRSCDLLWELVTSIVILSWIHGVYPNTLGCLFVCFVCRLLWLHALSVLRNSFVYSRYSARFLWKRPNTFEAWFS